MQFYEGLLHANILKYQGIRIFFYIFMKYVLFYVNEQIAIYTNNNVKYAAMCSCNKLSGEVNTAFMYIWVTIINACEAQILYIKKRLVLNTKLNSMMMNEVTQKLLFATAFPT